MAAPLMTLGIPLEVPSVELEFLIGRIVVEAHKVEKRRERKREKERADFATEVDSLSLSLPELLAAFGIREEQDPLAQTQSNFINAR